MKIQNPSTIPFKNYIRVHLQDKSRGSLSTVKTPMDRIINIASKNKTSLYVSQDVFILNSSEELKEDLKKDNIIFEEVKDINEH